MADSQDDQQTFDDYVHTVFEEDFKGQIASQTENEYANQQSPHDDC